MFSRPASKKGNFTGRFWKSWNSYKTHISNKLQPDRAGISGVAADWGNREAGM